MYDCAYIILNMCWMCVCGFVCLFASYWICLQVRQAITYECVSACFIQCPSISGHILMISPWSNYPAACITLSMWHTISRQLTWASECQLIGCAISPLSDISINIVLPVVTLKHQGAGIKKKSACLVQKSVSVWIYIPVRTVVLLLRVCQI